jgi:hypothetical protein
MELITTRKEDLVKKRQSIFDLSSAQLHIIAMSFMLIDHAMKSVVLVDSWIFLLGRLAFPIFAFMVAEGYYHTHDVRKYAGRMLIFAIISEVPYDLLWTGQPFEFADQNVIWTFFIALICMYTIDVVKSKRKKGLSIIASIGITIIGFVVGMLMAVDYGGTGVLMVLLFYFLRDNTWKDRVIQLVAMAFLNIQVLGTSGNIIDINIGGSTMEFPMQGFAVLALIPIWLYHGRQGYHSKGFQYFCYAFYPVHLTILVILARLMNM